MFRIIIGILCMCGAIVVLGDEQMIDIIGGERKKFTFSEEKQIYNLEIEFNCRQREMWPSFVSIERESHVLLHKQIHYRHEQSFFHHGVWNMSQYQRYDFQ